MAEPRQTEPFMTAEAFTAWYAEQPDGRRYELFNGRVYEMQGERLAHAEAKMRVAETFRSQIRSKKLPCQGYGDGIGVRADGENIFEPDAMVRCGPRLPGDTTIIPDPIIVVEVLSPTTRHVDLMRKFTGYFSYVQKVGARNAQAISKVFLAALGQLSNDRISDVRLAAGSVAPVPIRLTRTESVLKGQPISPSLVEACKASLAQEIQPIDDSRSTARYRTVVLANLLAEFLRGLAGERISS